MKSKKGIGQVMRLVLSLPIFILIGLFLTVGYFQLMDEFVIDNIYDITTDTAATFNLDTSWNTTLTQIHDTFKLQQPPFELLFALIIVLMFGFSIFMAIKSPPLPTISFLGATVFGLAIMLLITVFIDQFATWYLNDFFYQIFDRTGNVLLDWYFDNLSLINAVWMGLLLLLNQIEISITKFTGRSKGGDIVEE